MLFLGQLGAETQNIPQNPEGKAAETNYKLGTQLPYLFVISRLAHYIKVIQREQLGSWKERSDLERELNTWIRQYVADQENPPAEVRSHRPLRQAKIEVLMWMVSRAGTRSRFLSDRILNTWVPVST